MRILYVISSTETGGAEKALLSLATAMAREHAVQVISLKPLGSIATALKQAGVKVKSAEGKTPGQQIKFLQKEIKSFVPDLVHAMLFRAIEYTRMACAGKQVKLITTPHFDFSERPFLYRLADRALKECDTVTVAESCATAEYLLRRQKYRKDKIFLLPNGVDRTQFYKDENTRLAMRKKYGFHVKTVVFVCVARLVEIKNPLILVQAFRNVWMRNPDAKLVFVGEGDMRPKLEDYIRQSGMQNAVVLAGEQKEVRPFLNMADVFVLPSLEESLPLALLEALCAGLACIVSPVGDMPRWVQHGENGFVVPAKDITLLSCVMSELSSDETRRLEMGKKSLQKSDEITDNFQQYHQLYQQVITNNFHVKTNSRS
ncbi:MAG: glycosyltransferase family 4 protein [Elusimicrobiaceae bacterium]|nr:glycosyltransferase family 4 protein [Elusimicrobiaceae bacterium]